MNVLTSDSALTRSTRVAMTRPMITLPPVTSTSQSALLRRAMSMSGSVKTNP